MLARFSLKNYGPFRDETTLDLTAVKAYKEFSEHTVSLGEKVNLLRTAAIYGGNASGKTSILKAYGTFAYLVRHSFDNRSGEKSILEQNYVPYLFNEENRSQPTGFDALHVANGMEYRYGFIYNGEGILREWIYRKSLKTNKSSMILEREGQRIVLGASVKKGTEKYAAGVEKDVLALTFFSRLKLKTTVFEEAASCIQKGILLENGSEMAGDIAFSEFFEKMDEQMKSMLLQFLAEVDIPIQDLRIVGNNGTVDVFCCHKGEDGRLYEVPFSMEAQGTKKVLFLFYLASLAILMDYTLFVDELDASLHPLLMKYIVELFYLPGSGGQMIYTTHDTTLMDRRHLRRDQIWMVNREAAAQSSALYSLADFSVRGDASFRKEYLRGTYGGVPHLQYWTSED